MKNVAFNLLFLKTVAEIMLNEFVYLHPVTRSNFTIPKNCQKSAYIWRKSYFSFS